MFLREATKLRPSRPTGSPIEPRTMAGGSWGRADDDCRRSWCPLRNEVDVGENALQQDPDS